MLQKFIGLNFFIFLIFYFGQHLYADFFSRISPWYVIAPTLIFQFGAVYLMRSRAKGNVKIELLESTKEKSSSEFHNDFSKVGSVDHPPVTRPIDYTGNVFLNNKEYEKEVFKQAGLLIDIDIKKDEDK